ncbi:helix-turn-helix domain-containing protein [Paucibacter sp. B2R-40]|uniref:helix-turn-helix domain-containing protein n=1 Tax=Paucibacter sp. B2R-40 TaxID=2893554 RepID=UPI0021E3DC50|nr:helix-turn-helix transcriptional regulator [Paucibacter sp. B2R-40]
MNIGFLFEPFGLDYRRISVLGFAAMNKQSRQLSKLRDLCALDLPAGLLIPAVLEHLHALIPSARNLFDCCDEQGRLSQYYIEGPVDEAIAKHYFEEFHNRREAEVMLPFAHAVAGNACIHSAAQLNTRAFFNSALYWDIWRPQGFRFRAEAIVRAANGRALGSLVLYRGPGERCFKPAEEVLLAQVLPYLNRALSRDAYAPTATAQALWTLSADPAETLLTDAGGTILHASEGAVRLLLLAKAGLGPVSMATLQRPSQHPALDGLQEALSRADKASCRHQNHWGLFEFTAQRLKPYAAEVQTSEALIQIQLRRFEPMALAQERKLLALDLSPGQTSVCRLLLQGKSHAEVALQLGVAPSTVADHTRKLYKILQVRSVQELAMRVRPS